tara:strand:+ start:4901 stop:5083 length:183 start_codon:yes stop_codon:yes gene_type:complete
MKKFRGKDLGYELFKRQAESIWRAFQVTGDRKDLKAYEHHMDSQRWHSNRFLKEIERAEG